MKLQFTTNHGTLEVTAVEMIQLLIAGTHVIRNTDKTYKKQRKLLSSQKSHIVLYNTRTHDFVLIMVHKLKQYLDKQYRFVNDILSSWLTQYSATVKNETIRNNVTIVGQFELTILQHTNLIALHDHDTLYQEVVSCPRRSYVDYIKSSKPHYMRSELVQYGLNLGVIEEADAHDCIDFATVCSRVARTEIPAETIVQHHQHAVIRQCHYLVRNFSFFLSSLMNSHLRDRSSRTVQSSPEAGPTNSTQQLDQFIRCLTKCIRTAAPFPHDTFVYRFIHDDTHLRHLLVGDTHDDPAFISASRSPFCKLDSEFGFVLIKIKLPARRVGVGLMVETMSYFPTEEEIILPPNTKLKLVALDNDVKYYHTINILESAVVKRYEFVIESTSNPSPGNPSPGNPSPGTLALAPQPWHPSPGTQPWHPSPGTPALAPQPWHPSPGNPSPGNPSPGNPSPGNPINIRAMQARIVQEKTTRLKIEAFMKHAGPQFTLLGTVFTCMTFDSTGLYRSLWSNPIPHGLAIINTNPWGKIELMIEITQTPHPIIAINYIHRLQNNDHPAFTNDAIVNFGQTVAQLFDIPEFHIYCDFCSAYSIVRNSLVVPAERASNDKQSPTVSIGSLRLLSTPINVDFYQYLTINQKRYPGKSNQFYYSILESIMEHSSDSPIVRQSARLCRLMESAKAGSIGDLYRYIIKTTPNDIDAIMEWLPGWLNNDENPYRFEKYVMYV